MVGAVSGLINRKALFGKRIKCIIIIKFLSNAYFSETIQVSIEIQANIFYIQISTSTNMLSPIFDVLLALDHMYIRYPCRLHIKQIFLHIFLDSLSAQLYYIIYSPWQFLTYAVFFFFISLIFSRCVQSYWYYSENSWWRPIAIYQIFTRNSGFTKEKFIKRISKISLYVRILYFAFTNIFENF